MKITFFGTSHGVPSATRYCSSTLIETNGTYYVIDGGAPVIDELIRHGVPVERVRALFTTHGHGDHIGGILEFADLVNWFYSDASVFFYMTEQKLIDGFTALLDTIVNRPLSERVKFVLWDKSIGYEDENLKITLLPNSHLAAQNRPSYSLIIDCEGKRVLFTGDMSQNLAAGDFPLVDGVDLQISEMAHFSVAQVSPYLEKCTARRLVFNHVAPVSKLSEIAAMNGKYSFPVSAARDGETIDVN